MNYANTFITLTNTRIPVSQSVSQSVSQGVEKLTEVLFMFMFVETIGKY